VSAGADVTLVVGGVFADPLGGAVTSPLAVRAGGVVEARAGLEAGVLGAGGVFVASVVLTFGDSLVGEGASAFDGLAVTCFGAENFCGTANPRSLASPSRWLSAPSSSRRHS
jgi:hypothetical protein